MIDGGLRKIFRQRLPMFHWVTIETGLTEQGVPDSNYCFEGKEGWIEFKRADTNRVTLRSEQIGWLLRRSRAEGRTFVAVRYRHPGGSRKGPPADTLYIYPGSAARVLAVAGLGYGPLLSLPGGPVAWDFALVSDILRG